MTSFNVFMNIFTEACDHMISDQKLISDLKDQNFDLAIAGPLTMCSFAIVKKLEIPSHIFLCSSLLLDTWTTMFGFDSPPSYVPHIMSSYSDRMTFVERFETLVLY